MARNNTVKSNEFCFNQDFFKFLHEIIKNVRNKFIWNITVSDNIAGTQDNYRLTFPDKTKIQTLEQKPYGFLANLIRWDG